ncbi:hypothetical protein [Desulfobulbus sp.]|uniref:hypothetical protein n=1 Tax=Desulfobulbus sp. TaxID=895 RepID=UPI0027B99997|nr:hypothetical protein [Desulfobulbus sp.]
MPTRTPDPLFALDDPVSLIRARMQEKRLFEARFLCRQLVGEIGASEKKALERELTGLLTQVEQLRRQAQALVADGRREQAAAVYGEIAAIAIDVPGVAEEQRALEGAEALVARIAGKTGPLERPDLEPTPRVDVQAQASTVDDSPQAPPKQQQPGRLVWLAVSLLGILALLALLVWRVGMHASAPQSTTPPPAAQTITIRPLDLPPPAVEQPQQLQQVQPLQQAAEPVVPLAEPENVPAPPSPSLKLGTLQVEDAERR